MGKNFAMMEMRIILSHLFRNFSFALAEPVLKRDPASFLGINRGTMGPQVCSTVRSTTTAYAHRCVEQQHYLHFSPVNIPMA
jgi:hypothetical protein